MLPKWKELTEVSGKPDQSRNSYMMDECSSLRNAYPLPLLLCPQPDFLITVPICMRRPWNKFSKSQRTGIFNLLGSFLCINVQWGQ
jgi:hypothetical protein